MIKCNNVQEQAQDLCGEIFNDIGLTEKIGSRDDQHS